MKNLRFKDIYDDPCIFYNKEKLVMIGIFVNDGIVIDHDERAVEQVLFDFNKKFKRK